MLVIKRDGRAVNYDRSKIILAIQKANSEVEPCEKISDDKIEEIVGSIEAKNRKRMLVEDIQDIIEQGIMLTESLSSPKPTLYIDTAESLSERQTPPMIPY